MPTMRVLRADLCLCETLLPGGGVYELSAFLHNEAGLRVVRR